MNEAAVTLTNTTPYIVADDDSEWKWRKTNCGMGLYTYRSSGWGVGLFTYRSYCGFFAFSALSMCSGIFSLLSFSSAFAVLSVNSFGSFGSVLSVTSAFSVLSVNSFASINSVNGYFSINKVHEPWVIPPQKPFCHDSPDCKALADIWHGTGQVLPWNRQATTICTWDPTGRPKWSGVTCAGGRVVGLDLSGHGLTGTEGWADAVSKLSELNKLDLSYNFELGGMLPSEWGALTNLELVLLTDTSLTGTLPAEFGRLKNLTRLRLNTQTKDNGLSGTLPSQWGGMGSLKELVFREPGPGRLSGTLPTELGRLSHLEIVAIDKQRVSGTLPTQIGRLTSLNVPEGAPGYTRTFWLEANRLSGTVPTQYTFHGGLCSLSDNPFACPLTPWAKTNCSATCVNASAP